MAPPKKIVSSFVFQQGFHHHHHGSEAMYLNRNQDHQRHERLSLLLFQASKTGNIRDHHHEHSFQQKSSSSQQLAQAANRVARKQEGGGGGVGGHQKSMIVAGTTATTTTTMASCCSPLSMSLDELSINLQGRGRAQAIWDCYRAGIDPFYYYGNSSTTTNQQQRRQNYNDDNNNNLIDQQQRDQLSKWILECKKNSSNKSKKHNNDRSNSKNNNRKRRSQQQKLPLQLGMTAYKLLQERFVGPLEEMVGKIEQYTVSKDSTIKLLIQLQKDQLLVETVLIPDIYKNNKKSETKKNHEESIPATKNTTSSTLLTTTFKSSKDRNKIPATLCVSSQVGCAQGCTFCQTGRMGRKRSLTADEILVQVVSAIKLMRADTRRRRKKRQEEELQQQSSNRDGDLMHHHTKTTNMMIEQREEEEQHNNHDYFLDNVVFMGMGEPADNIDNVAIAVNRLVNEFQIPSKKITVSTIGTTPMSFMELSTKVKASIAWSVHAVNDQKRKHLVPTTRYSMIELRQGLMDAILLEQHQQQYEEKQRTEQQQRHQLQPLLRSRRMRVVMIEVVLINGMNDSIQDAYDLGKFCLPLVVQEGEDGVTKPTGIRLIINLIPFNDMGGGDSGSDTGNDGGDQQQLLQHRPEYQRPSPERVIAFQNVLLSKDIWGAADYPGIDSCDGVDTAITATTASHHNRKKQKQLPWRCYVRTTRGDDASAACGQLVITAAARKLFTSQE